MASLPSFHPAQPRKSGNPSAFMTGTKHAAKSGGCAPGTPPKPTSNLSWLPLKLPQAPWLHSATSNQGDATANQWRYFPVGEKPKDDLFGRCGLSQVTPAH